VTCCAVLWCRLTCPWPVLLDWACSFDLTTVDKHIHQHLPYGKQCTDPNRVPFNSQFTYLCKFMRAVFVLQELLLCLLQWCCCCRRCSPGGQL
jgi:hypothetical protein